MEYEKHRVLLER